MKHCSQYERDMDYIATFEKECARDPEFLVMNPKASAYVNSLYKKYNLIEGEEK